MLIKREILLKKNNATFWDYVLERNGDFFVKEHRIFLNKINSVYANMGVFEDLDDGTIDFKVTFNEK